MSDSYTEVTRQSWFGRIGNAFKGIVLGLVLFGAAFPLLFWNEGRAVTRYRSLKEGAGSVVSVAAERVEAANEGALVHVSGEAVTEDRVAEPQFGFSVAALKLQREVEIYQWKERSSSSTKKNVGGSTTTETTYTYEKAWVDGPISSGSFKQPEGHTNTGTMRVRDGEWVARPITVGAFTLSPGLVGRINNREPLVPPAEAVLPADLGEAAKFAEGGVYIGADPGNPAIGDLRVRFYQVPEGPVSLVSRQVGTTFEPYRTKAGGTVELLQVGTHSAEAMFERAQAQNRMLTWLLRGAGLLVMMIGLNMVFKPLSVVADVLPILGSIVGAGTGLIAFLLALGLSAVTIAVAWLVYRPLLGILLLAVALGAFFVVVKKLKQARPAAVAAAG